jgi:hypothetical protein
MLVAKYSIISHILRMWIFVNLDFALKALGKSNVADGAVVCRTPNAFPASNGFHALPVTEIE